MTRAQIGYGPTPLDYAVADFVRRISNREDYGILDFMIEYEYNSSSKDISTIKIRFLADTELRDFGKEIK